MKKLSIIIMIIALFATTTHAETLLCDANIRDANGNIIGTAGCGDTVTVTGYDERTGRVIVYDECTGAWGTVVEGALGDDYCYDSVYYDDYDDYTEETDAYYYDTDCYCDQEYTDCYEDYTEDAYETYPDCPENYDYTPEYVDYNCSEIPNSCGSDYVDEECIYQDDYSDQGCVETGYCEDYVDDYTEDYYTGYGDTWIDINLGSQTITVYSDTNQLLASCCVTGMAGIMDTPVGVWSILDKQRNATLVGDDYECPVDYWMPFTGSGCGIHDAAWRDDFSPDAYTYAGSHGCVNVGYDTAGAIYDLVDCGTSVVVHY